MKTSAQISRMVKTYDEAPMEWEHIMITIKQFINMVRDIDLLPIHQRPDVEMNIFESKDREYSTKRQAIITSIFKGSDIGEIKINERTSEERIKFSQKYESIDGGHRSRAIVDFCNRVFATNGFELPEIGNKLYSNLTDDERDKFLNYRIRIVIYKHLTPSQKCMLWATSNNLTALNHQEQMNGVGDTPLANLIRNLARGIDTPCHKLFALKPGKKIGSVTPEYLSVLPSRLSYDRLVARIATVVFNGSKPCNVDDADIEKMYFADIDQAKADAMQKKIVDVLNFIHSMVEVKISSGQKKMSLEECILLYRIWFTYQDDFDSFKINKIRDYWKQFRSSWMRFHPDSKDPYGKELINGYDGKEQRNRFAVFRENLGKASVVRWKDNIKWIEDRYLTRKTLIDLGILTIKEKRKTLSKELRELILHEQGDMCYIDNKPLSFKDAHAAHIVPLCDGGSNDRNNICMVRAEHNTRMGTMHLEDYKSSWNNKAA
jgi:hypothetical protein